MYKNITNSLLISKELKQKIDFICKFASVKYELIPGNIISIIDTNIGYVRPHILKVKGNDYLIFEKSNIVFKNGYNEKIRLIDLVKEVEKSFAYFDNFKDVINNLTIINDNLKGQRDENIKLEARNIDLIRKSNGQRSKINELTDENNQIYEDLRNNKISHIKLITYLVNGVNSKDEKKAKTFMRIATVLNDKRVIKYNEYKVVLNPPKIINEREVLQALKHINEENKKASEEVYKVNDNDYNII